MRGSILGKHLRNQRKRRDALRGWRSDMLQPPKRREPSRQERAFPSSSAHLATELMRSRRSRICCGGSRSAPTHAR